MTAGGQVYYFGYDQVGSLRVVTNASGTVVKRIDYDSFGNILSDSNPSFTVPFGFAGGLHDRDTGLVRFGARDYGPAIGKWTAKDPIDFVGGDLNLLSYVGQDPVNWADPGGLYLKDWIKEAFKSPWFTAVRTAIEVADIIPIPSAFYQIPLELGSFVATGIDIWVADVSPERKLAASAVAVYGLLGTLQTIPTIPTVLLGTIFDTTAFIVVGILLDNDPLTSIINLKDLIPTSQNILNNKPQNKTLDNKNMPCN